MPARRLTPSNAIDGGKNLHDIQLDASLLKRMVKGLSNTVGEQFLNQLSETLADVLNADLVYTGKLTDSGCVQTLCLYMDGKPARNFEYLLAGTPCIEVVQEGESRIYPRNIQSLFPEDKALKKLDLHGYAAAPLKDSDGKIIGLLVVFSRTPIENIELVNDVIDLFALRASAELQRLKMENALQAEAEERRQALARAEAATLAKSQFLANLSHEFRTPLNGIIGVADLVRMEVLGPVGDERYQQYAGDIRACGLHLLHIFEDLLDISAIELGEFRLHDETLYLADAIAGSLAISTFRAKAKNIQTYTKVPVDLPALRGDRTRIVQTLVNLLTNAYKFSHSGGEVTVSAYLDGANQLILKVSDTGIGIAEGDIERVLRPFEQITTGVTNTHGGTGLGLALVKQFMEMHGGEVSIESVLKEGTTVTLTFPAERTLKSSQPAHRPAKRA